MSAFLDRAWQTVLRKITSNAERGFTEYPLYTDPTSGVWVTADAGETASFQDGKWRHGNWMAGFWPGLLWLAHARTGEDRYARWASEALEPLVVGGTRRPNILCLSHDGHFLASTWGEENQPVLWDLRTRSRFTLDNLGNGATSFAISREGVFAVGTVDGIILLWNLNDRTLIGHLASHSAPVTSRITRCTSSVA